MIHRDPFSKCPMTTALGMERMPNVGDKGGCHPPPVAQHAAIGSAAELFWELAHQSCAEFGVWTAATLYFIKATSICTRGRGGLAKWRRGGGAGAQAHRPQEECDNARRRRRRSRRQCGKSIPAARDAAARAAAQAAAPVAAARTTAARAAATASSSSASSSSASSSSASSCSASSSSASSSSASRSRCSRRSGPG